jgi:purine-nucleoside phosphorylase
MKLGAPLFERVQAAARAVAEQLDLETPSAAVVLGSGLGGVADRLTDARRVPYASLPGFPETTVAGHPGRLVAGKIGGNIGGTIGGTPGGPGGAKTVLLLCGRVHGYEGYPPSEVGFGVRVVAALGVRTLIVSNAAGAVDPAFAPGEIVAISDHINLTSGSPLTGPNDERLGPRFVDMTDAYDPKLRALAQAAAPQAIGRPLREAIYAGMAGPAYETPAEVRLLRTLGAGLVGMSTVHEVIAARHAGLSVLGLSLVANLAAGVSPGPLRHEDVTRAAAAGTDALGRLVAAVVAGLDAP